MDVKVPRVLQVMGSLSRGGAETVVMNYYRNIDTTQIQFDFLVHKRVSDGYEDEIIENGGRIFEIQTLGKSGIFKYVSNVVEIINNFGPFKAVHAHTDYQSGAVVTAAKIAGVERRLSHSHSTKSPNKINSLLMPIYRLLINSNSNIKISCGEQAGKFLYGSNHFSILNNAIDVKSYQNATNEEKDKFLNELELPNNKIILGHIGRFVPLKNHKFLIEFLENLRSFHIDAFLILVGDGPIRKDVEKYVELKGLQKYVRFTGLRKDIPVILNSIDCLLLPSEYEGLPMVLIEGQAAGKSCLVSDSVSSEVDMGLGLISFLSTKDNFEAWRLKLKAILNKEKINYGQIEDNYKKKGYDILSNVEKLKKFYLS